LHFRTTPQRATVRLPIEALQLAPEDAERFELAAGSHLPAPRRTALGAVKHNLPPTLTSFVGREAEIGRLQRLLDPSSDHTPAVRQRLAMIMPRLLPTRRRSNPPVMSS
jgi:hypothetical protein